MARYFLLVALCGGNSSLAMVVPYKNTSLLNKGDLNEANFQHIPTASTYYHGPKKRIKSVLMNEQQLLDKWAHEEECKINMIVNHIHDKVDEDLLGISKDSWFRSAVSWHKSRNVMFFNRTEIADELKKIESYVPVRCSRSSVWYKLRIQNTYFCTLCQFFITNPLNDDSTINELQAIMPTLSRSMLKFLVETSSMAYRGNIMCHPIVQKMTQGLIAFYEFKNKLQETDNKEE